MPHHEFGIMPKEPKSGKRYDHYEPEKYGCISVSNDYIVPFLDKFHAVKCYWHTLDRAELGLAYYGITLIPPTSLGSIIEEIKDNAALSALSALLLRAEKAIHLSYISVYKSHITDILDSES